MGNKMINEACNEAYLLLKNGQISGKKSEIRDAAKENVSMFIGMGLSSTDILAMTNSRIIKEFGGVSHGNR